MAVTTCNFWALLNTVRIIVFYHTVVEWVWEVVYLKELRMASPTGFEPVF